MAEDQSLIDSRAADGLAVAPPPAADTASPAPSHHADVKDTSMPEVRPAKDANDDAELAHDPKNESAKLDVALDETFPNSDPPANTQPGKGLDPAPSSGFDEDAEAERMSGKD
ncbi:MAG: hypothetical protein ABW173_06935 [Sphingomonas sp.]